MTFLDLLAEKKYSVYRLSKESGIALTTLQDISSGKKWTGRLQGKDIARIVQNSRYFNWRTAFFGAGEGDWCFPCVPFRMCEGISFLHKKRQYIGGRLLGTTQKFHKCCRSWESDFPWDSDTIKETLPLPIRRMTMVGFIEYGGANGNKLSIIINDELWMLKLPSHVQKNANPS